MQTQSSLLEQAEKEDGQAWILMLDAGRADYFKDLWRDYAPDSCLYKTVHNGGNISTPYWFNDHFSHLIDGHLFHGGQPIRSIYAEGHHAHYDETEWWAEIPSAVLYETWGEDRPFTTTDPEGVNSLVYKHLPTPGVVTDRLQSLGYESNDSGHPPFNFNLVRYLQPHTPYRMETEISDHWDGLRNAVKSGRRSYDDIEEYYIDNYRWGLKYASRLAEELHTREDTSRVVITADHGECLGRCGDFWHSTGDHDHLFHVPWLEWR